LKRKTGDGADYSGFKRKIFLQILGMAAIALAVISALYLFVWRGNVGDLLVSLFQSLFNMSPRDALAAYRSGFRGNFEFFFLGAVIVTFIFLLGVFLKWFTRYFDLINGGIDALIDDRGTKITLIPEMAAIEKKLNTVRLTLEQRARDARLAEQRKNDLVMYVAHDIRTPLTSIIGYLSLLNETPDMPTAQRAVHTRTALEKAYRLEQLINEFFEITRFNSGAITLSKKTIDLYYMLQQITDEFYPQLKAGGKRIRLRAGEGLRVYGDSDKLARVFNNLLKNAVAYSDGSGVIDITAFPSGPMTTVVFKNPGAIPEDKLSVIFEKFRRLDRARSSGTGGAGLGLVIAKEIVALHGGSIRAESGGGQTAFTVKLPAGPLVS
jgi:two-component system sensor histidine kinase VanS